MATITVAVCNAELWYRRGDQNIRFALPGNATLNWRSVSAYPVVSRLHLLGNGVKVGTRTINWH
jgi:hypothetical protein